MRSPQAGKDEKARIRTEHIVREDFTVEAYDIISLLCELVLERTMLLASEDECPFDMREAVSTLIYAANRTEIPELAKVKDQLTRKQVLGHLSSSNTRHAASGRHTGTPFDHAK